ncbi:unnamed protein product [Fasciola hepatica]|uniref:Uncharacterized protein n=1 Tax=Fasciola hepatica TaxID=6192 RepID=A0ABC9HFE4_FASHE
MSMDIHRVTSPPKAGTGTAHLSHECRPLEFASTTKIQPNPVPTSHGSPDQSSHLLCPAEQHGNDDKVATETSQSLVHQSSLLTFKYSLSMLASSSRITDELPPKLLGTRPISSNRSSLKAR